MEIGLVNRYDSAKSGMVGISGITYIETMEMRYHNVIAIMT